MFWVAAHVQPNFDLVTAWWSLSVVTRIACHSSPISATARDSASMRRRWIGPLCQVLGDNETGNAVFSEFQRRSIEIQPCPLKGVLEADGSSGRPEFSHPASTASPAWRKRC